jgi:hypothetical protein
MRETPADHDDAKLIGVSECTSNLPLSPNAIS